MPLKLSFEKRLKELRDETGNEEMLRFIDFMEVSLQWLQDFFNIKKFSETEFSYLQPLLFPKTFTAIKWFNKIKKPSFNEFDLVEKNLFREARILLSTVIDFGLIDLKDFNLLQFNLQRSVPEKVSIVEQARTRLHSKLDELNKLKELQEAEEKELSEFTKKFNVLPERERNALIFGELFDFSPGAKTLEERNLAVKKNRERVLKQKERFKKFEGRLALATAKARSKSLTNLSELTAITQLNLISRSEFEKKRFARKEDKAKKVVQKRISELHDFIGEKGFANKVKKARENILEREEELALQSKKEGELISSKGKKWKKTFLKKTEKAAKRMLKKKRDLSEEQEETAEFISARGSEELVKASKLMLHGKEYFEEGTELAEERITEKRDEIAGEKTRLLNERDSARGLFEGRGDEIEDFIGTVIEREKAEFVEDRDKARQRFLSRGNEIRQSIEGEMMQKKQAFADDREKARNRFQTKAGEIKETGAMEMGKGKKVFKSKKKFPEAKHLTKDFAGKTKYFVDGTVQGKQAFESRVPKVQKGINEKNAKMLSKARQDRDKTVKDIKHMKDLFEFELRFAKYDLQKSANKFQEHARKTNELFQSRQKQLVARHKAKQKAHLIRNLLRTIRQSG